jgi:phosphoribosylformimino-5-aminoimidazole carboxamide ribotide isomerase
MMSTFTVYPAIDLRGGQVVRLRQGDPDSQTTYSHQPGDVARDWIESGATWLHVVNLDGAFGEADSDNLGALESICQHCAGKARVQFGGGLRSLPDLELAFSTGVSRCILGTAAIENPALVKQALNAFGAEKVVIGIDSRNDQVMGRGWRTKSDLSPLELGAQMAELGIQILIFTNILRDGIGTGVDLENTRILAEETGLEVIASGGVRNLEDVKAVKDARLSGVIIGRALYEKQIILQEALAC